MTFIPKGKDCVKTLYALTELLSDSIILEKAIVDAEKENERIVHLILSGSHETIKSALENISKSLEKSLGEGSEFELFERKTSEVKEKGTSYSSCFMTEYEIFSQAGSRCKYPDIKITAYGYVSHFGDVPF